MITSIEEDTRFLDEISSIPGGEKIRHCIQCGTCSASCPMVFKMNHSPRKLFAMAKAGMRKEVLSSNTIWYCVSCYSCHVRCPRGIKLTDIMYILKRLSINYGFYKDGIAPAALSRSFVNIVNKYGRNHETELVMRLYAKTGPWRLLRMLPLGIKLILKGRMPIFPHRIKKAGLSELKAIMKEADILGGEK
jgi:heterodisulfide reductase subunit C